MWLIGKFNVVKLEQELRLDEIVPCNALRGRLRYNFEINTLFKYMGRNCTLDYIVIQSHDFDISN